jgi:hypothetical protein
MGSVMRGRRVLAISTTEWDQVWAEYDARRAPEAPPAASLPQRPQIQASVPAAPPARAWSSRTAALGLAAVAATAWLAASAAALWQVAQAVERRDAAMLGLHMDAAAVRNSLRDSLARGVERPAGPQAASFLDGMAEEMAEAWTTPGALTEVARARGVRPGAAAEGLLSARPVGLTALELPIATPDGAVGPMRLRLELGAGLAPRWQVTEVRIRAEARQVPFAPPTRLTQLR